MKYSLVEVEGAKVVTVFVDGKLLTATDHNPNFQRIVDKVHAQDETDLVALFDLSEVAADEFQKVSERVSVSAGRVYLDGVEVKSVLTDQIVRFLNEGQDFAPLVNFYEKVETNPSEHSREQLYRWLKTHDFTITSEGKILGYKGVIKNEDGTYASCHSGPAIVDGKAVNGHVPNNVGSVVEMARNKVTFDPAVGCSHGLHVGTWDYASSFARGAVLTVEVDPRDVVSVPTDCADAKMRVCRYTVKDVTDTPHTTAVYDYDDTDDWYCQDCGEDTCGGDCDGCETYGHEYDYYGVCDMCGDYNEDEDEHKSDSLSSIRKSDVTQAQRVDTRLNYQAQKRGPDGRFLPK